MAAMTYKKVTIDDIQEAGEAEMCDSEKRNRNVNTTECRHNKRRTLALPAGQTK